MEFVNGLVGDYNNLVTDRYGNNPDSTVVNAFRLYHAFGDSFNVTVMKLGQFNNKTDSFFDYGNSTDFVAFVFVPVPSPSLRVMIDNTSSVLSLFKSEISGGHSLEGSGYGFTAAVATPPGNNLGFAFTQGASNSTQNIGVLPLIWVANVSTLSEPYTSATKVAAFLFHQGQLELPKPKHPNSILAFLSNPWVLGIGFIIMVVASIGWFIEKGWPHRKLHPPKKQAKRHKH